PPHAYCSITVASIGTSHKSVPALPTSPLRSPAPVRPALFQMLSPVTFIGIPPERSTAALTRFAGTPPPVRLDAADAQPVSRVPTLPPPGLGQPVLGLGAPAADRLQARPVRHRDAVAVRVAHTLDAEVPGLLAG